MGEKVARVRKLRRFKQEYVAEQLKMSQPEYSVLEQESEIADDLLNQIAEILGVPLDFIKNFDEDRVTYNINNVYDNNPSDYEVKDQASHVIGQQYNNNTYNTYSSNDKMDELQRLLEEVRSELKTATLERDNLKKENETLKNSK